nr:hypothetical protein [Paracidobacterium acidisoli]
MVIDDQAFLGHQHLVEEPFGIAVKYLCDLSPKVMTGFAESVNDFAEVGFVDAQHLRQAILSNPAGEHPQLQVWVYVSVNWHFLLPNVMYFQAPAIWYGTLMPGHSAIGVPNREKSNWQHFVELLAVDRAGDVPKFIHDSQTARNVPGECVVRTLKKTDGKQISGRGSNHAALRCFFCTSRHEKGVRFSIEGRSCFLQKTKAEMAAESGFERERGRDADGVTLTLVTRMERGEKRW